MPTSVAAAAVVELLRLGSFALSAGKFLVTILEPLATAHTYEVAMKLTYCAPRSARFDKGCVPLSGVSSNLGRFILRFHLRISTRMFGEAFAV